MLELIDRGCRLVAAAVTFATMLLIVADATGRSLGIPVAGAVEITEEYLMVAIVFLAMGFTYRQGRHIRIELFERWLPWLAGAPVRIAVAAISLVYFALIAWQGLGQTREALAIDKRSASELAYPMAPAYALVVVGSVVICLWLAHDIVALARGRSPQAKDATPDGHA